MKTRIMTALSNTFGKNSLESELYQLISVPCSSSEPMSLLHFLRDAIYAMNCMHVMHVLTLHDSSLCVDPYERPYILLI